MSNQGTVNSGPDNPNPPGPGSAASTVGVWPAGVPIQWGRTDQGIDGQAPPGTIAGAVADGTVQINHDPSGFGANYAILHLDKPLTACGSTFNAVYYGHLFPMVADGAHVSGGQPVAQAGQTGGGNASGERGGFELGFFDPSRGPVPNTGDCASQFFKGQTPGTLGAGSAGGGGSADCDGGCHGPGSGKGISFSLNLQSIVDSAVGTALSPDVGGPKTICILTGCQLKALVAGLITAAGGLVTLLGVAVVVHWGMHETDAGRAAGGAVRKVAGAAGFLAGPEAGAATELLTHLGGAKGRQQGPTATQQRTQQRRDLARIRKGEGTDGAQPPAGADQPSQATETPEQYLARMQAS